MSIGEGKRFLFTREVLTLLEQGEFQLGSINVASSFSHREKTFLPTSVLSLPFLFSSAAEPERIFESSIGDELLQALSDSLDTVVALAFTYSGGPLLLQSNFMAFDELSDFEGKNIGVIAGMSLDVMEATGARAHDLRNAKDPSRGTHPLIDDYDAIETTYARIRSKDSTSRFRPQFITETNHSLFVTGIVVSEEFLAGLSERDARALKRAARAAALVERADTEALARQNKAALVAEGTEIIAFPELAENSLRERTNSLYVEYERSENADFLKDIQDMQE